MPHIFDIVCVGNAKIDQFLSIHQSHSYLRLNRQTNELCLRYGEKIPIDNLEMYPGGNAANVSVGLSRLGLKSAIVAEIGEDEFSQKIIRALKAENVDTTLVRQTRDKASSLSIIISFNQERTILSQHIHRNHEFVFDTISTKWIYLTSLGEEWKNTYEKTYDFVRQKNVKLAFNPGTLQIDTGYEGISDILKQTNILFVNKEEAMKISNFKFQISNELENIKNLLGRLQKLGPKVVVITDGKNGSYAVDETGEMFTQDAVPCKIVEKAGAGDAYSSGFLAAYSLGHSLQDAMRWGTLNATSTMQKVGAQNGLLYKTGMKTKLNAE